MIPLFLYRLHVRVALRLRKISGRGEQAVIDSYDALVDAEAKRREV